jgi:hypothetical protein
MEKASPLSATTATMPKKSQPPKQPAKKSQTRGKQAKTFIKVIEIWRPTAEGNRLMLADSLYDNYERFHSQSQTRSFAYDEGLPGKAWSSARPQIITNIAYSFFRRKEAAIKAGLSSGIAIPIFAGDFLLAVIVLLCGEDEYHTGAIELWGTQAEGGANLGLLDGYYGNLKSFEWISRQLNFGKGSGLPGTVWQSHSPVIFPDLGHSSSFIRAKIAQEAGITTGLGIPFRNNRGEEYALTFLSAMGTPIARHFEIWIPDKPQENLFLLSSHSEISDNHIAESTTTRIKRGKGLMGMVWLTGCPAISHNLKEDGLLSKDNKTKLKSGLIMPINDGGKLKAIVNMLF